MSRRRPIPMLAGSAVLALLVAIGGCADGGGAPSGGDTTPTSEAGGADATTTTLDEEGLAAIEELVQSLLVQAADLGDAAGGYEDQGYSPGTSVATCGDGLADPPADVLAGTALGSSAAATTVVEELRVYPSEADAAAAFEAAGSADGCGAPSDVTATVGADAAVAFATDDPAAGTFVLALVADTVLAFHVTGTGLDPLEVAAFGAGKVLAALEN